MYGRVAEHLWVKRPQEAVLEGWFKNREALFWPLKGPGGAGKTSLLFRFLNTCKARSVPVVWTQPDADLAALAGDRRALRLLLMLQTAHTPEFDKLKAELASPDVVALFDAATAQALLGEGVKHLPQELQGLAGLAQQILSLGMKKIGSNKEARRRALAARPEEFLLAALCRDMKAGGVWLVDTWEKVGPEHQLSAQTRLLHRGGMETCSVVREITVDVWLQELAVFFRPRQFYGWWPDAVSWWNSAICEAFQRLRSPSIPPPFPRTISPTSWGDGSPTRRPRSWPISNGKPAVIPAKWTASPWRP